MVIRCVHCFDWRKKHAQVINESTSHLFFSFQKRISSRIPTTDDGRWHREKVSQVASWGRARVRQESERRIMPARRTTTTLEKTKKNILNTTNTSNYTDDKDDEKTRPKKGEKKKQKSQQKQQHVLSQEKKKFKNLLSRSLLRCIPKIL